jgi:hypothetical protein
MFEKMFWYVWRRFDMVTNMFWYVLILVFDTKCWIKMTSVKSVNPNQEASPPSKRVCCARGPIGTWQRKPETAETAETAETLSTDRNLPGIWKPQWFNQSQFKEHRTSWKISDSSVGCPWMSMDVPSGSIKCWENMGKSPHSALIKALHLIIFRCKKCIQVI